MYIKDTVLVAPQKIGCLFWENFIGTKNEAYFMYV